MNILFMHPNFPAQFLHLSHYFGQQQDKHRVFFLTEKTNGNSLPGVNVGVYAKPREATKDIHHYVKPLEEAVLEGQAAVKAVAALKTQADFVPDVIVGHTGWGSMLYLKDLYHDVPVLGYFEWYYHAYGSDVGYFPGEVVSDDAKLRIRTRNAQHLLGLEMCDVFFTPTEWQRKQIPERYRDEVRVIHEGVDTEFCRPNPGTKLVLKDKIDLSECSKIVTYVSRGFEPYRGFPQFMEAVRILLKHDPDVHVVIVGSDMSCYGPAPGPDKDGNAQTWKTIEEKKGGYDTNRVHFLGHLDRLSYRTVMQLSTVHVYLTRPFILSWSAVESMSFGCCLVASQTPPVQEVAEDGVNCLMVNFRSPEHIAFRIEEALKDADLRKRLGKAARETVLEKYDVRDSLVKQVNMIYGAMK